MRLSLILLTYGSRTNKILTTIILLADILDGPCPIEEFSSNEAGRSRATILQIFSIKMS